jgi:hypothetical protein
MLHAVDSLSVGECHVMRHSFGQQHRRLNWHDEDDRMAVVVTVTTAPSTPVVDVTGMTSSAALFDRSARLPRRGRA